MKNSLKNYYHADVLGKINQKIKDWKLEPLLGRGLVSRLNGGRCAYAHIELSIIKGDEKHSSSVIWSTTEHQIPYNFGHVPIVEEALTFFSNYISGIKGERISLAFEITYIGIHIIDTEARNFKEATMKALIDCFDKEIFIFNKGQAERISSNSSEFFKSHKMFFPKSEILESLRIKEISEILGKIFSRDNVDVRMFNGMHFNTYVEESFAIRKALLNESELLVLRKHFAVNESDQITDIGKANIARIIDDFYDLRYHFNISYDEVKS